MERELTCREFIEFIDDYLTGDLPVEVRAASDHHLSKCPYCEDYLKTFRTTLELVRSARGTDDPVPEELIRAILAGRSASP